MVSRNANTPFSNNVRSERTDADVKINLSHKVLCLYSKTGGGWRSQLVKSAEQFGTIHAYDQLCEGKNLYIEHKLRVFAHQSEKNSNMESFLNALLRATLHSKIVTVVATLLTLLCSFSLRTRAQGCPALETADFTTTLIAANSDCDTPAHLTVSYRNAVVGFTAMTYRVSKDGAHWGTPVVMPRPEAEATLPLDRGRTHCTPDR